MLPAVQQSVSRAVGVANLAAAGHGTVVPGPGGMATIDFTGQGTPYIPPFSTAPVTVSRFGLPSLPSLPSVPRLPSLPSIPPFPRSRRCRRRRHYRTPLTSADSPARVSAHSKGSPVRVRAPPLRE